nr:uncharacterized protein LOC109413330 isoform X1 [Aedes albopictus]
MLHQWEPVRAKVIHSLVKIPILSLVSILGDDAKRITNGECPETAPPFGYSSDYEYDCLDFPCASPKDVQRLERSVKESGDVRKQYVNYLRASRFECQNDLERVLRRMFEDEAFAGCNYTTLPIKSTRPNLTAFSVLNECMLEAWMDLTPASLYKQFSELIPKMARQAYKRQLRTRRSNALQRMVEAAQAEGGEDASARGMISD